MSDFTEVLSDIGQINIETAQLISGTGKLFDITLLMMDLTLYEDIFANTMSGYVIIQDALDMINNVPLIGQELFRLVLGTPTLEEKITKTFYIYKLEHRKVEGRSQIYQLHFCSRELIYSQNSKISKAYDGLISENVIDIFEDPRYLASESLIYFEETANEYTFIPPFWTPLETINWLAGKSVSPTGAANYLFFETNQSFEFVSVDILLQQEPVREFVYSDMDYNSVFGAYGDKDKKYSIVESMENSITFDYLRNLSGGMYASKLYLYDLTSKLIQTTNFDYVRDFENTTHLGKFPLRTENLARKKLSNLYFIEKNNYRTGDFVPQGYQDYFLQRNSLLEQMAAFKVVIKVPGRTDIKAGNVVKLTVSETRKLLKDDIIADEPAESEYFTGKYLVTAIRHQIINGSHSMEMEIVSDSFAKELGKK